MREFLKFRLESECHVAYTGIPTVAQLVNRMFSQRNANVFESLRLFLNAHDGFSQNCRLAVVRILLRVNASTN